MKCPHYSPSYCVFCEKKELEDTVKRLQAEIAAERGEVAESESKRVPLAKAVGSVSDESRERAEEWLDKHMQDAGARCATISDIVSLTALLCEAEARGALLSQEERIEGLLAEGAVWHLHAAVAKELDEALALLVEAEWAGDWGGSGSGVECCPWCRQARPGQPCENNWSVAERDHTPDCRLRALLVETGRAKS